MFRKNDHRARGEVVMRRTRTRPACPLLSSIGCPLEDIAELLGSGLERVALLHSSPAGAADLGSERRVSGEALDHFDVILVTGCDESIYAMPDNLCVGAELRTDRGHSAGP